MNIKKKALIGLLTTSVTVLLAVVFGAAQSILSGGQLNYQGRIVDQNTQQPISDGDYNITFSIYDAETDGNQLWDDTYAVTTKNGLFNHKLGPIDTSVFDGSNRFLEIEVEGETIGSRQKIVSVASAIRAESAEDADTLGGHPASDFAVATHQHSASDIASGTLSEERLPQNAIDSSEIEDGSITKADLDETTLRSSRNLYHNIYDVFVEY